MPQFVTLARALAPRCEVAFAKPMRVRDVQSWLRQTYEAIERLVVPGQTTVVSALGSVPARIAQEALKLPNVALLIEPEGLLRPQSRYELLLRPTVRRMLHRWRPGVTTQFILQVESFRAELKLPPIRTTLSEWARRATTTMCPYPAWALPPLVPLPRPSWLCGFIESTESERGSMPAALRQFLEAGKSPIVLCIQQWEGPRREALLGELARQVAASVGRRVVLLDAPRSLRQTNMGGDVLPIEWIAPEHLMPWAATVVHDGNSQVAAAAMRAAIPQMVIGTDEWSKALGTRLRTLGVADRIAALRSGGERVARRLQDLLSTDDVARYCEVTSRRVKEEDAKAIECAMDVIESFASREFENRRKPVVSMSTLGRFGRFGNQVLQYGFLRIVAKNNGHEPQCGDWAGETLFGHKDARPTTFLRPAAEAYDDQPTLFDAVPELLPHYESRARARSIRITPAAMTDCPPNVDLCGNFMFNTSLLKPYQHFFRSLYEPAPALRPALDDAVAKLRSRGKTIIGIQIRRGDFISSPLSSFTYIIPPEWWRKWLRRVWDESPDPVLFIAGDDIGAMEQSLREFRPVTAQQLDVPLPPPLDQFPFILDHWLLRHCDVAGISNSSFGFTACMLNERGRAFYRLDPTKGSDFEPFDPWNAPPLLIVGRLGTRKTFGEMVSLTCRTQGPAEVARAIAYRVPIARLRSWLFRTSLAFDTDGLGGATMTVLRVAFSAFGKSDVPIRRFHDVARAER